MPTPQSVAVEVDQQRERDERDELGGLAVDLHAGDQRGDGDHRRGDQDSAPMAASA